MVDNKFYKCKICGTTIRLREQIGYFDRQIDIYCPSCNTHFSGGLKVLPNGEGTKYEIENLIKLDKDVFDGFVFELSSEFLTRKADKNTGVFVGLSPFMRHNTVFEDDDKPSKMSVLLEYSKHTEYIAEKIVTLSTLFNNGNFDLIINNLKTEDDKWIKFHREQYTFETIKNEGDVLIAMKHYLTGALRNSMTDFSSDVFNNVVIELNRLSEKKEKDIIYFVKYLNKTDFFKSYINKFSKYIHDYMIYFNHLIPVIHSYNKLNEIDLNTEGITTVSIERLSRLYADGYELLCDFIDVVAGLENTEKYGAYDNFGGGRSSFSDKIHSYRSKIIKYNDSLDPDSVFSTGFIGLLDNTIRNAISHNDVEIKGLEQIVVFNDNHNGKHKEVSLYFVEFAKKCIDVYNAVLVLWEFCYQLHKRKVLFIDKLLPNYALAVLRKENK